MCHAPLGNWSILVFSFSSVSEIHKRTAAAFYVFSKSHPNCTSAQLEPLDTNKVKAATGAFAQVGFTPGSVTFSLDLVVNPSWILNMRGREREESLGLKQSISFKSSCLPWEANTDFYKQQTMSWGFWVTAAMFSSWLVNSQVTTDTVLMQGLRFLSFSLGTISHDPTRETNDLS